MVKPSMLRDVYIYIYMSRFWGLGMGELGVEKKGHVLQTFRSEASGLNGLGLGFRVSGLHLRV